MGLRLQASWGWHAQTWPTGWLAGWAWGLLPVVALSLGWQWRRLFGLHRYIELTLLADGRVDYRCHDGVTGSARVDGASTVMSWGVVLLLRPAHARREALTLLPDALNHDDFRCLRLWLRWRADVEQT